MNIRDQRKLKYVSVKKLTNIWETGGIKALGFLLNNPGSIIEKDSWIEKIKELYNQKKYRIIEDEIKIVTNVFKYNNDDEAKEKDRRRDKHRRSSNQNKGNSEHCISGKTQNRKNSYSGSDPDDVGQSVDNGEERGACSATSDGNGRDEMEKMATNSWGDIIKRFFGLDKRKS